MKTLQAIRLPKLLVEGGKWQTGKMPRTAFPLSKAHSYALGTGWQWCVHRLVSAEGSFRLLIAYHPGKEQYQAWLGLEVNNDQALLARLEYHPDADHGWHCHLKRGSIGDVAIGVVKQSRTRDRSRMCKAPHTFNISELNALNVAFRVFTVKGSRPSAASEATRELFV